MQEVRLERFDASRIRLFLHRYLEEDQGEIIYQQLCSASDQYRLIDLFSLPYYLAMLAEVVRESGILPRSRADLFTLVVRDALVREIRRNNRRLSTVLNSTGRRNLQSWRFVQHNPHYLADDPREDAGKLVLAWNTLAQSIQAGAPESGGGRRIAEPEALHVIEGVVKEESARRDALYSGADANLLEQDDLALPLLWSFRHHQLQEYFAARDMVRRFRMGGIRDPAELWSVQWRKDELEPLHPSTLGRGQRYPDMPEATGWEETTTLAAGLLANEPDVAAGFIQAILPHNPVLAARCLVELHPRPNRYEWPPFPEALAALADETRKILLARMSDPDTDRRARLGAGFALGDLGDPRFPVQETVDGVKYIAPHWCEIPGGTFMMGSADDDPDAFNDEKPAHSQTVDAFRMAAYPVTVAEYACFVAAGGYEDKRWWETEDAKKWLKGKLSGQGELWVRNMEYLRSVLHSISEAELENFLANAQEQYDWNDWRVEYTRKCAALGDEAFEEYKNEIRQEADAGSEGPPTQPNFWDDADYTNPSQPVVGVSWYEARAYCAWLAHCLGKMVRLPVEPEWERAARGPHGWKYPWGGDFDLDKANTFEGRIRRPSPVGAFPAGASPWGMHDMAGNVYEWTLSLWGEDYSKPTTGRYPYLSDDGREDIEAPAAVARVLRGGSFSGRAFYGNYRCAARIFQSWESREQHQGFRICGDLD